MASNDPSPAEAQEIAAAQSAVPLSAPGPGTAQLPATGNLVELEVDWDHDSAYGDSDYESITTSISSSNTNYKLEHGRRYHAFDDRKYPLPNDDEEINRLELQHRIWQLSLHNRLAMAPIPAPSTGEIRHAIDIGCGTGAWVIDFAESYPNAKVIGVDLSPIQPHIVPPNVEFIVDDLTNDWIYQQKFDYVHSRSITVGVRDWSKLVDEVWKNLQPGGWVEFDEYHMPMTCDDETTVGSAFVRWNAHIVEASQAVGVALDAIFSVPEILAARGFVNPGRATTKWALGPWPKDKRQKRIGSMFQADLLGGLEGITMRMFTKVLGWEPDQVLALLADVREEIRDAGPGSGGGMHAYMPINIVWAQKPEKAVD